MRVARDDFQHFQEALRTPCHSVISAIFDYTMGYLLSFVKCKKPASFPKRITGGGIQYCALPCVEGFHHEERMFCAHTFIAHCRVVCQIERAATLIRSPDSWQAVPVPTCVFMLGDSEPTDAVLNGITRWIHLLCISEIPFAWLCIALQCKKIVCICTTMQRTGESFSPALAVTSRYLTAQLPFAYSSRPCRIISRSSVVKSVSTQWGNLESAGTG
jgi:hypothetical protein